MAEGGAGRVLVAGAINTDLVARVDRAPEAGQTITGRSLAIFGGGKGANQTLASARSGARTAILGRVGRDEFGRQRLADLQADGVETAFVSTPDGYASGVALITVEEATGENRIAYVPGATLSVTPDAARAAVDQFKPSVVLSTLELPDESIQALLERSRELGARVVLNATPEAIGAKPFLDASDVLVVNETEAMELLRLTIPPESWHGAAEDLVALGPSSVVITLGSKGAVGVLQGIPVTVAPPPVRVVDTTGAGDALCGAFAAALAGGGSLVDAVRRGVAAGSFACTVEGAQRSMPTAMQIDELLTHMPSS